MVGFLDALSQLGASLQPLADYQTTRQNESNAYKIAQNPRFAQALSGVQNANSNSSLENMRQIQFNQEQQKRSALQQLGQKIGTPGYNPQSALGEYAGITGDFDPVFGNGRNFTPAAIQEFQYLQNLSPEEQKIWFANKRGAQLVNQGGYTGVYDPLTGGFSNTIDKTVSPDQTPALKGAQSEASTNARLMAELGLKPQITEAVTSAKNKAEGQANLPKLTASYNDSVAKGKILDKNIDDAISKVSGTTAGFAGSKLANVAGTPAADLAATLKTIRANLGFDELQKMRNNSPTGGALGSVSENENALLQSAVTNLENTQSPEQLKQKLQELKQIKAESNQRIKQAYDADLARFGSGAMSTIPSISQDQLGGGYEPSQAMPPQLPVGGIGNSAPVATKTINGVTYIKQGDNWFAQ